MILNKLSLFFLFLSFYANSQPLVPPQGSLSTQDFSHQIQGCPENSTCDATMGHHHKRWIDLLVEIKDKSFDEIKKARELESFRQNLGLPSNFYTNSKSQQGFKPILFDSPCKHHKNKEQKNSILKGEAFVQKLLTDKAILKKDQTMYEIPYGELFTPQEVTVYDGDEIRKYYLSLGDQPSYFDKGTMIIMKEAEDLFFQLSISDKLEWTITPLDLSSISKYDQLRETVACPQDKEKKNEMFRVVYCKKVWDQGFKKFVIVKMQDGCV